jgi:rRNA maturation protein Nop10
MAASLRQCPHCQLLYEGSEICPACGRNVTTPPKTKERRKTSEVPKLDPTKK